jgi:hypothetical protein
MPAAHTLLVFSLVAAAFVAVPGPSNLFVLARGLQSGSRAAVAGAAGCATGALVYVAATAAGLSALLASSHVVFAALHYAGAAYLCWLGVAALRSRAREFPRAAGPRSPWRSYRQGLGVLGRDDAVLEGVARLLAPGGEAMALVSVMARDGVPGIPGADALARAYVRRGLELVDVRPATREEIAASASSWAKRLRAGTARPVTLLRARAAR